MPNVSDPVALPLLIPPAVVESWDKDPAALERFLLAELRALRNARTSGVADGIIVRAGLSVLRATTCSRFAVRSYQRARLLSYLSKVCIERGTRDDVELSLQLSEESLSTYERAAVLNDQAVDEYVESALQAVVAVKALGDSDTSIWLIRSFVNDVMRHEIGSRYDVMALIRQELMMEQTEVAHRRIADEAPRYRTLKPREYYRSVKRLFEWLLNHGRLREATDLLPELRQAFRAQLTDAEPIVRVSFMKNLGQYHMLDGDAAVATHVLGRALMFATHHGLGGQERQIRMLLEEIAGGQRGSLATFRVV